MEIEPNPVEFFTAEITAKLDDSGTWVYSWKAVRNDPATNGYADVENGQTGAPGDSPAYEVNNQEVDVGTIVFLRVKGEDDTANVVYEFAHTPPGGGGGGGTITVEASDGSPTYTGINTLQVEPADGSAITNPSSGVARILAASATTS